MELNWSTSSISLETLHYRRRRHVVSSGRSAINARLKGNQRRFFLFSFTSIECRGNFINVLDISIRRRLDVLQLKISIEESISCGIYSFLLALRLLPQFIGSFFWRYSHSPFGCAYAMLFF